MYLETWKRKIANRSNDDKILAQKKNGGKLEKGSALPVCDCVCVCVPLFLCTLCGLKVSQELKDSAEKNNIK